MVMALVMSTWHGSAYDFGLTSGTLSSTDIHPPIMTIDAIGDSSGLAINLNNNSVNDLSDIYFNTSSVTDGQVWYGVLLIVVGKREQ